MIFPCKYGARCRWIIQRNSSIICDAYQQVGSKWVLACRWIGAGSFQFGFNSCKKSPWMSLNSNSVSGESIGELEGTQNEQIDYLGYAKREEPSHDKYS